jgi:polysaccharide deacetylase 2 family uncharacterized protein YibQ
LAALLILAGAGLSFGWLAYRGELDRLVSATPEVEISLSLPAAEPFAAMPGLAPEPDRLASAIPATASALPQPAAQTRPPIIRQPMTAAANPPAKSHGQVATAAPPAPASAPPAMPAIASPAPGSSGGEALNYPTLQLRAMTGVEAPAWQRFARPFDVNDPRPRIAIVVLGLGLLHGETAAAIDELPSEVTLSFSPYSHSLDSWIVEARSFGHEVMLDLPMAPSGQGLETAAADEANPQALATSLGESDNLRRLDWVLARGQDYVGVAGVDAGGISAAAPGLSPVLSDIGRHGLMFLGPAEAGGLGLPRAVADLSIDDRPDRDYIDGQLAELERRARETGYAVGVASGYPVTIERLALWSRGLEQKNLALAPVSALVGQQASR